MSDAGPPGGASASDAAYQQFLLSVSRLTGADGVSLMLRFSPAFSDLAHLRKTEPLRCFTDKEAAELAIRDASAQPRPAKQSLIRQYPVAANGVLLRITVGETSRQNLRTDPSPSGIERRKSSAEHDGDAVWVALRFAGDSVPAIVAELSDTNAAPELNTTSQWLAETLSLAASTLWEAGKASFLLRDPTSKLPGRAEFQARLKALFLEARVSQSALGLLLVNPDDFGLINQRIDHESGDRTLGEIAGTLRASLRRSDLLFRYGGAVFAVLLPRVDPAEVDAVARKILQALGVPYLDDAVRLNFSIGSVIYRPDAPQDTHLDDLNFLRRADQALNRAKLAGGGCAVRWDADDDEVQAYGRDRLSGIFTADTEKDYRNMLMLWDTIAVLSSAELEQKIATKFVERISLALKPGRTAVIVPNTEREHQVLALAVGALDAGESGMTLTSEHIRLLDEVRQSRRAERVHFNHTAPGNGKQPFLGYAVPILAGERYIGALYIDGPERNLVLDSSDLVFLNALCGQVGLALDRAELASRWKEGRETESRRLRKEVQELRQVVHSARMVYTSTAMQTVLDTVRAVAPTDVTILITGESGTGKELLARSVHDMSKRKEQTLVTVDCGAIAHSLLEAELFGRVKGAYTGADRASPGRIMQADGGTLFLDEVGELPLDVQAKLLRFVQEKEISPVGATDSKFVDVRIVAATNRDLEREVAEGRFRKDLFYRLNVVTVSSPPLRERREDILPLSTFFLEKFALQYDKGVSRLSPEAEQALQLHHWPGNVRELQNSILRAVVLSTGEVLGRELLVFEADDVPTPLRAIPTSQTEPAAIIPFAAQTEARAGITPDPWADLEHGLRVQLTQALAAPDAKPVPLGRWLTEDLILAADQRVKGVARRGAAMLGVAETTYRRRLEAAQSAQLHALLTRTPAWVEVQPLINRLIGSLGESSGTSILERARSILLAAVNDQVGGDHRVGSALMGITKPTYRRWLS